MLKKARKEKILDLVNHSGYVTLEFLAQELETSESTVRRDLTELDHTHKLKRLHGGAESLESLRYEENVAEKSVKHVAEKRLIAKKAVEKLEDGDVIFMDAGTTVAMMTPYISDVGNLTVVTNSVHTASELLDRQIKTIVIGGVVKATTDAVTGNVAVQQIMSFNFSKAFVGANGISRDGGITTPDDEEATIKRLVLGQAKKKFILADSSKLGKIYFAKIAEFDKSIEIITEEINDLHSNT
ncbi:DeoR/GlpR family DNA-binding transcription regulator [Pseudolactococcus plantarum]|uniref:DeoR family transcriptional regulator n=1 Tax=Pseudolactococcus plantarum TaxID=1365 RepID=A0A2A5S0G0_9LACT|nr:DeoR/GlpR family DNA-binding transcription regulator [Lactococcus plantarum]PCS06986.1 DeoR family transcriptional regulator [Lactococcus plantarum]HCN74628.1 DeoR/GlpR transcriptional regulator [Lactococcus sp.]